MDISIKLNKEEVIKFCEKDKNFEVYIQRAALNYLKNNRLKPLMKSQVVGEIETYKRELKSHVSKVLKDIGFKQEGWNANFSLLDDDVKKLIQKQVSDDMEKLISEAVHKQLVVAYNRLEKDIKMWNDAIKTKCEREINSETIKNIAKLVIESKFQKG